ncbi:MAG: helicase-related protein, partial [Verrucomicrobiota bacterium]
PEDKERVMTAFREGRLRILVSTAVIEVGVDVANATLMVIENAERFGLAQLHQLRGRVGRGAQQSYCVLVGTPRSGESWQRLKIMEESNDGFRIAEADLEIRGPGNVLGTEQSGLPPLRVADLRQDVRLLEFARDVAREIVEAEPAPAASAGSTSAS